MSIPTLPELEREVVRTCRALHARGWVAGCGGSVTALTSDGKVLATPLGVGKGDLRESDLLLLDREGKQLAGSRRACPEAGMHLAVMRGRGDVRAVVHAHPPRSTAFAVAGRPVEARFLAEFTFATGGAVPVVPFALPGTEALAGALQPFLEEFDVVLLQSHGVLAWGPDLATALHLVEHCEEAAGVLLDSAALGGPKAVPDEMVRLLLDARTKAGLGPAGRARKL